MSAFDQGDAEAADEPGFDMPDPEGDSGETDIDEIGFGSDTELTGSSDDEDLPAISLEDADSGDDDAIADEAGADDVPEAGNENIEPFDPDLDDDEADDGADEPELHDIESEAEGAEPDEEGAGSGPFSLRRMAAAMAAVLVFAMAGWSGYAFRETITRWMPAAGPVYAMFGAPVNLTGIEFGEVGVGRSFDNGFPVLSVKGKLKNVSGQLRQIPDIRLALRSPGKQEIYHWTIKVKRAPLKPNEQVQFSTRLASPPVEAEDIVIRFHKSSGLKVGAL